MRRLQSSGLWVYFIFLFLFFSTRGGVAPLPRQKEEIKRGGKARGAAWRVEGRGKAATPAGRAAPSGPALAAGAAHRVALTQLSLSLLSSPPPPPILLSLPLLIHPPLSRPLPVQAKRARQEAERAAARPPAGRPAPPPWVGSAAWGETAPRWRRVAAGWRSRNSPAPLPRARPARVAAAAAPTAAGRRRRGASRGRCPRRGAPAWTASGGWRGAPPAAPCPRRCRPAAAGAPPASPRRPPRCSPPPAPAGPAAGRWWCRPRCAASASMCFTVTCTDTSPRGAPASPTTHSEYRRDRPRGRLVRARPARLPPGRAPSLTPSPPAPASRPAPSPLPPPGRCPRLAPRLSPGPARGRPRFPGAAPGSAALPASSVTPPRPLLACRPGARWWHLPRDPSHLWKCPALSGRLCGRLRGHLRPPRSVGSALSPLVGCVQQPASSSLLAQFHQ